MADGVDIDLYSDDIDPNFQMKDGDYVGDEDLYDDVVAAPSSEPHERTENSENGNQAERSDGVDSNGSYSQMGNSFPPNYVGRRHQLYVGNLTWWTTDKDITDAVSSVGISDFQEVKFFENRANGQSKGFCVVTLGSETSMRMCLERLPKSELHGQKLIVTLPTKAALAQFESVQKTRPIPPQTNAPRGQAPMQPMQGNFPPQQPHPQSHPQRMMMPPNGPPGNFRPMPPQNMPMQNQGPPRMQQPMMQGRPMGPGQGPGQGMPRFPNQQNQWNGPRQNGPRMPPNGPPHGGPHHRPMFQGNPGGMGPRGIRNDWNRPPNQMHQGGFQQPPNCMPNQNNQMMQGPPRGPPPQQMPPNNMHNQQMPAPHVNPAFFNQNSGPPQHHGPPNSGMNQPPQNMQSHPSQHFGPMDNGPRFHNAGGVKPQSIPPTGQFPEQPPLQPQMSEAEFEEIMNRNRTVSSSAIARAVSDAAAGEAMSAIETLVTAISLIKQSKVAHDERCKILISSLQDTLHGIENKSYTRRSRSRERPHRDRGRDAGRSSRRSRDRSTSKERRSYRDRSRERENRSSRYYESGSNYRSRSRDRTTSGTSGAGNSGDHYERSKRARNKSPDVSNEQSSENSNRYYDERYSRSSRDRERERRDDREHRRH